MTISVKRSDAVRLHAHWLLYIYEVIKAGSIRGAATALNVAPSAISRKIKEIENILGAPLFDRNGKKLMLTAAGEVVAEHVNQVLRGLSRMQGSLDELRNLRSGHVEISATPATAPELLPNILASCRKKYPRITFHCRFSGSGKVAQELLDGNIDIGIGFNPPVSHLLRHIVAIPLPLGAIVAPTNRWAQSKSLKLYDLVDAGEPLILPDETLSMRSMFDDIMGKQFLDPRPVVTTASRDLMVAMAQIGVGVAFQTPVGVERELREGNLIFVPLMEPTLKPRLLTLMVAANRPLSPAANMAVEAARSALVGLLK